MLSAQKKSRLINRPAGSSLKDDPYGTRTRVAAVKGQCPRPLDEGAVYFGSVQNTEPISVELACDFHSAGQSGEAFLSARKHQFSTGKAV